MERKIGEIFEYKGEWYQCVEGYHCYDCDFRHENGTCIISANYPESQMGNCNGDYRTDNQNVVFKKLEKAGEPYVVHDHSRKDYVTVQDYKLYKSQGACYTGPDTLDFCPHGKIEGIVAIEIKENKEDMEKYKMHDAKEDIPEFDKVVEECLVGEDKINLKPFDIHKAKAGKPVCTRDGRKARIICFDAEGEHPIIALVTDGVQESPHSYTKEGYYHTDGVEAMVDLMMFSEKKEMWINIYKSTTNYIPGGSLYDTEEAAKAGADMADDEYFTTTKVSWEE